MKPPIEQKYTNCNTTAHLSVKSVNKSVKSVNQNTTSHRVSWCIANSNNQNNHLNHFHFTYSTLRVMGFSRIVKQDLAALLLAWPSPQKKLRGGGYTQAILLPVF